MRSPLWSTPPSPQHPPLAGDVTADVCVVGGGIAGLTAALLLAHGGKSVVLLEGRGLGTGTTGRSTAKVTLLQGTHVGDIDRQRGRELARAYVEANQEGQAWLRRFCADHGVGYDVQPAYTCATTAEGEARARAEADVLAACGLPAAWTADTGLPLPHRGGASLPDQGQIDPMALVAALGAAAYEAGTAIHEHSRAVSMRREGDGLRVRTDAGSVRARHVVVATNAPIHDLTGFFARQESTRSHVAAFRSDWQPPGMYLTVDAEPRSVRGAVHDGERVVIAAGGPHLTGAQHPAAALEALVSAARQLPVGEQVAAWSAQDQSPVGHLPFAGPLLPGDDRVLVMTGFEKWGLATAPAAALLLSQHLLGGRPASWGTAYRTWSPSELRALRPLLLHNGSVGCKLAAGHAARLLTSGTKPPVCTHLGGVLVRNDTEDTWDCPLHGSRFTPDGQVLEGPATRRLG